MTDEASGDTGSVALGPDTRLCLHDLAVRRDGDEWIVGRPATRTFVAIPGEGAHALELLRDGRTLAEASERLRRRTGEWFDVVGFAEELVALGFVGHIDGRPVAGATAAPASLPGVRPEHLRFALHPLLPLIPAGLLAAAVATVVDQPGLLPHGHDLLWTGHGSVVLASVFVCGWILVLLHELAHFAVARATGVAARFRLGTRLNFLVAETDISGIELASRRHRATAYLAGMAVDVSVASAALLLEAHAVTGGAPQRAFAALALLAVTPLAFQFMVFMRTDVYFVIQDFAGCRDLFGDGRAYARYAATRLRATVGRRPPVADPSRHLPRRERRVVRLYSVVLVVGTAVALAGFAFLVLPGEIALLTHAAARLGPGHSPGQVIDAATVLLIVGGSQVVWAVTRLRRRRARAA
ncbi:MAG: hypothetical protein HOV68_12050 [Streptomycetaceae bacterium]|nr:hypothetical protein [Streptomycetaceae bacterium]